MKKKLSWITVAVLVLCMVLSVALAEEEHNLPLPETMPESYVQYCQVDGTQTNGVTFVVESAVRQGNSVTIHVLQLPNDDYTSLIDNQVACEEDDPSFIAAKQEAAQYGQTLLGTVCDIDAITDENGNSLFEEYKVETERNEAALAFTFSFDLPAENEIQQVNVVLGFGVNEDLSSRFTQTETLLIVL